MISKLNNNDILQNMHNKIININNSTFSISKIETWSRLSNYSFSLIYFIDAYFLLLSHLSIELNISPNKHLQASKCQFKFAMIPFVPKTTFTLITPIMVNFTRSFFFLAFLSSTFILQPSANHTLVHLHFYFHEKYRGENATSNVVVSLNRPNSTFGNIVVFDNPLHVGPESCSKLIGRAQGTAFRSAFAEESALAAITLLFNEGEFNGSSISVIGLVDGSGSADRTVVGGSGRFRMAKGYLLTKIVNSTAVSLVAQYDAYIWI